MKYFEIVFNENGKSYIFSTELDLNVGDNVIVETDLGVQFGTVVSENDASKINIPKNLIKSIQRMATEEDVTKNNKNIEQAKEALTTASKYASELNLDMKFTDAMYSLDKKQLLFTFFSENRVDFRELLKKLSTKFHARIELRQLGIRDKARIVGGVGVCGRNLCCSKFLGNLNSISMNMAKNQNLSLNPNTVNGACGRLMCCLSYEDEEYKNCRKGMPRTGQFVDVDGVSGRVVFVDILNRKYVVDINGERREVNLDCCEKCKKRFI